MSQSQQTPPVAPSTSRREETASAYELDLSPRRRRVVNVTALAGIAVSLVAGWFVESPTLWGLLPVLLYAVLCLLGMDIVVATVAALVSAVLLARMAPIEIAELLGDSVGEFVTMIGLIIMLGAGVGEVLRVTGVAERIVRGIMSATGARGQRTVLLGVMLACLVLVVSLGTLAGAIAIAAPIIIPVTHRVGFTRSATAAMMFVGGCAGLALAPFAGSNVAILDATGLSYPHYVRIAAGPLALLSIVLGMLVVPWIQRRSMRENDYYTPEEAAESDTTAIGRGTNRATVAFGLLLVASVTYATVTAAGTAFPLLALPLLGIATGYAAGLPTREIGAAMYRGGARLISMVVLFWLLAALFAAQEALKPYEVILQDYGPALQSLSGLPFAFAIALLGWVGVPGATAAQVALLDKVFGELAGTLGIGAGAWAIVLLWASKGDTYGPWPNANMIGPMGLARSSRLKNQLLTGWTIMVAACVMYPFLLVLLL